MAAAPRVSEIVADRYEVSAVLGRGGMGVVYAARNRVTGREVALKWLSDEREQTTEALQRLLREAQAAGRIHHPNVVDIYDVGEHAGSLFLVMERLHGRPLSELLDAGPVAPGELLASLLPAMRGVAAAHRQGVIHRDLKPSNIFLCCDDAGDSLGAKVLDFGVSKIRATSLELGGETLTRSGALMGTPQYMAPELFDESRTIDARVDIYALGVILYRALSGELPFKADTFPQLVLKVSMSAPRPLLDLAPEVQPELAALVMRALEKDPDARFSDVPELVRALEPFAGRTALSVPPPRASSGPDLGGTPIATETRVPTRSDGVPVRAFVAGALGALAVGAAALGLLAWRDHSPDAAANHAPAASPDAAPRAAAPPPVTKIEAPPATASAVPARNPVTNPTLTPVATPEPPPAPPAHTPASAASTPPQVAASPAASSQADPKPSPHRRSRHSKAAPSAPTAAPAPGTRIPTLAPGDF